MCPTASSKPAPTRAIERHFEDPARVRSAATPGAAGVASTTRSAAVAGVARARRVLADLPEGCDRGRRRGRPALLRQAPGHLRHRRARPDVRRLAPGLLASARVALPDLRG